MLPLRSSSAALEKKELATAPPDRFERRLLLLHLLPGSDQIDNIFLGHGQLRLNPFCPLLAEAGLLIV